MSDTPACFNCGDPADGQMTVSVIGARVETRPACKECAGDRGFTLGG